VLFHLRYQGNKILQTTILGHIVLVQHGCDDFSQNPMFVKQLPDSVADSVEAKIDSSLKVQENGFTLQLLAKHVVRELHSRRRR